MLGTYNIIDTYANIKCHSISTLGLEQCHLVSTSVHNNVKKSNTHLSSIIPWPLIFFHIHYSTYIWEKKNEQCKYIIYVSISMQLSNSTDVQMYNINIYIVIFLMSHKNLEYFLYVLSIFLIKITIEDITWDIEITFLSIFFVRVVSSIFIFHQYT